MGSNDGLIETDIKNRACCYFDDIIKIEDFGFDNILIVEKSYEDILAYSISNKSLIDFDWLRIRFDEIDGFLRVYDGTRYLVLFGSEKCDCIYSRIIYFINLKIGSTYIISHNYPKIKVVLYDSLPLEKTMTFHDFISLLSQFLIKI